MTNTPKTTNAYKELRQQLVEQIRTARVRAAVRVNSELVLLYYELGRRILADQEKQGWGAKVIDQFSRDLRERFPEMRGLSTRNLKYMRAFARAWPKPKLCKRCLHN